MIQVDLPGLTLTNEPGQSVPALRRITGWFDSPEPRLDTDEMANSDGDFEQGDTLWRARYPNIIGELITGDDPMAVFDLNDRVQGIFAHRGKFPLTVTDPRGAFTAMVRPGGRFDFPIEHERGIASFVIPLYADDPLKYGPAVTVSTGLPNPGGGMVFNAPAGANGNFDFGAPGHLGRVTLTNDGVADVWPEFMVTGYLQDGFFLNCLETGEYLRFDRVVPPGSTVTIRSKTWETLIDGENPWTLTQDQFFSVPAKSTRTVQFNAITTGDASARLDATVAPGYLM